MQETSFEPYLLGLEQIKARRNEETLHNEMLMAPAVLDYSIYS